MAIHFVSSTDGDNGNSGHTLDLAWATLEYALESGTLVAGDTIAVRRTHSEIPISDITIGYSGSAKNSIIIFGCPRNAHSISSSDWANGSTEVVIDDADMDREKHQGRYITAPDGESYLITRVVDSSNIVIDREYAGSTVTNNANASIQADEAEPTWDNYDDSGDTIKKANWESDADDLPVIDFNDTAFQFNTNYDHFLEIKNIEFKDSSDTDGIIYIYQSKAILFQGCLIKQSTQNTKLVYCRYGDVIFNRCIFEGSGSGAAQVGFSQILDGKAVIKNSAIYNCGDFGISAGGLLFLENLNIGVEQANGDSDIEIYILCKLDRAYDIKLGGSNGYVEMAGTYYLGESYRFSFENYQKILGAHRTFWPGGYFEKAAVAGETPNKKVSDNIIKIAPNISGQIHTAGWAIPILIHEVEATASAHTYRYWIYNDSGVTLNDISAKDDIWLEIEYIKSYDDTSEYTIAKQYSTQIDILDAADADDWDYLEASVTTAASSKVRLKIYLSKYLAATNIFIDPAVVIS